MNLSQGQSFAESADRELRRRFFVMLIHLVGSLFSGVASIEVKLP